MAVMLSGANPIDLESLSPALLRGLFDPSGGRKWEKVIYFRSPQENFLGEKYANAGWVTWGDSQVLKMEGSMILGFMPMRQFGNITDSKHPWEGILAEPRGRALFPVDQILAYKWYDVANLRRDWLGCPAGVRSPVQVFPQLRGVPLELFACPNCRDVEKTSSGGLFSHLLNIHNMTSSDIFAYFEHEGIEFKMRNSEHSKRTVSFEDDLDGYEDGDDDLQLTVHGGPPTGRTAGRPRDRLGHLLPGKPVRTEEDDNE